VKRPATLGLPAGWLADLGDAALRAAAGDAVFRRGLAYSREGRVELVHDAGNSARFEAAGTETYEVDLTLGPLGLEGGCDCPHAAEGNFCKHQVAAAMVWRCALGAQPDADSSTAAGAPPPPATPQRLVKAMQTRAANQRALREFLNGRSAAELADRLWQRAEQDRGLMAEIKAWAARTAAPGDARALRAAVDALLKVGSRPAFERRDVREWAQRAQQATQLMHDALQSHAVDVRPLVEMAGRRWATVYERAVDLSEPLDAARDALNGLLDAALRADPPPAGWGERFFEWLLNDGWLLWDAERLVPALGSEAARAFSKRLAEQWKKVEARANAGKAMDSIDLGIQGTILRTDPERDRLRAWMTQDLQRRGDLLAVFEFLRRSARGATEHAALIRWADEHGREREALKIAQEGMRRFQGHAMIEDELLVIYERDGWDTEALAIRRRRFDERPSVESYGPLLDAARRAKVDLDAERHRAHAAAAQREEVDLAQAMRWRHLSGGVPARDVGLRVGMLVADGELDAAVALVQPPNGAHPHVLEWLAERLPKARKADALALMKRALVIEMHKARSPYREALRLVAKGLSFAGAGEREAWLNHLARQYAPKRSFAEALVPI
jgi:hypothetical protein